jgi:hypothetical protein
MRTLLGAVLVLVMGAAGCQPSKLEQCREAVKLAPDVPESLLAQQVAGHLYAPRDLCHEGFPEWGADDEARDYCNSSVLSCLRGS